MKARAGLGHSSIVLTADTYISVLPELARQAAEDTATLVIKAGYLVPGTRRPRHPSFRSLRQRSRAAITSGASLAHPARQIGHPALINQPRRGRAMTRGPAA
jgi:RNA:NAD 2'-phosphotransferase (TPT1/KptA family)